MRAPVAATPSGVIAFTVPAVPIGMKAGVSIAPCAVVSRPTRAAPSRARISKPRVIEEAQARRADRDDAPAAGARLVDARSGLGGDDAPFGMHRVVARVLFLDRQK